MSARIVQIGPRVTVSMDCMECHYKRSEFYAVQGDSGHRVTCHHPSLPEAPRRIGDTTWTTPSWCPEYSAALAGLAKVKP